MGKNCDIFSIVYYLVLTLIPDDLPLPPSMLAVNLRVSLGVSVFIELILPGLGELTESR